MKINYFLLKQIKKNFSYLLTFFLNIILIVFLIFFYFQKRNQFSQQKTILEGKIQSLERKKSLIDAAKNLRSQDIDFQLINQYLNSLIPNNEDFFSIITALENLSQETGFIITSYELSFINTNEKTVSIAITGVGNMDALLEFLKKYRFSSGRLITIDKIDYYPEHSAGSSTAEKKLYLTFYSQKKQLNNNFYTKINENDKRLIFEILSKTKIIKNEINPSEEINYPSREDPFEITSE